MNLELVSEERLKQLAARAWEQHKDAPFSRAGLELMALDCARAALGELGIGAIVDVNCGAWLDGRASCPLRDSETRYCQHPLWDQKHCMRGDETNIPYQCNLAKKGAVLVRAKEKR